MQWRMPSMPLLDKSIWHASRPAPSNSVPQGAERAYQGLAERSYSASLGARFLDVRGQLRRATFNASGELGQVEFDVEGLVELVERACAFVRAATSTDTVGADAWKNAAR